MDEKTTEKTKALRWFLIERFLLIMAGIYISGELISMLYRGVVFPILFGLLKQQQIEITNQTGTIGFLLQVLLYYAADFLPNGPGGVLRGMVSNSLSESWQISIHSVMASGIVGEILGKVLLLLLFMMLLVSLLPYMVGAFLYYKIVTNKVNELLERDKEQRRQFDRKRNLLLSDIAHDIKTPITTICGYSRALADGVVTEEKQQEYLDAIYAKSMRMSDLITLLFEYVKLDSEGYALQKEEGDFAELVRESTALLYADFEEKDMQVDIRVPENPVPYEMDKLQMGRAVTNLLTNAIRYGRQGGKVLIQLEEGVLTVADDGMEIEPEFAEHIFEPFSRADKARSTKGGSGLGLSISAKVVQMHGGSLELHTDYGKGYTKAFMIRLQEEK